MMQSGNDLINILSQSLMKDIHGYSDDQLQALLNDDSKLDLLINTLPQITSLPSEKEVKLAESKSLAECNLSMEPKIKEARTKLSKTYAEALKLKQEVETYKSQLDNVSDERSLDSVLAVLQAESRKAEDESEALAEKFYSGQLDPEKFVKQFEEKRLQAHKRKVKAEKLSEILKEQDYGQRKPSQPSSRRMPYPDTFNAPVYPPIPPRNSRFL